MSRRRLSSHASEEESLWQVVYIDFLTIMTTLYLLFAFAEKAGLGGGFIPQKIILSGDTSFESGKDILKPDIKKGLKQNFTLPMKGSVLLISGHTDDVGLKNNNIDLAFRRAKAVYNQLVESEKSYADNVVICAAADNVQMKKVVPPTRKLSIFEETQLKKLRSENRRIEIERIDRIQEVASKVNLDE